MSEQKLQINEKSLTTIKEFAIQEFLRSTDFGGVDPENTRILLLFEGLYRYLKQKGIEPPFEVKMVQK